MVAQPTSLQGGLTRPAVALALQPDVTVFPFLPDQYCSSLDNLHCCTALPWHRVHWTLCP